MPYLQIGSNDIGLWLQYNSVNDNYNYWLDMTSKLYYNRISPGEYQSAMGAQLGPGSIPRGGSLRCLVPRLRPRLKRRRSAPAIPVRPARLPVA